MSVTSGPASGLAAGTMVATAMGWRPVEAIARGDLVLTFDRGMQPVKNLTKSLAWVEPDGCPASQWPLLVPANAIGNAQSMLLLPDQLVMLESDSAEILYGDPFTLISASDLAGFRDIQRICPEGPVESVMLHFEHDEVVFAQNGALVFCAGNTVIRLDDLFKEKDPVTEQGGYVSLDADEALFLLECLEDEDCEDGDYYANPRNAADPYAAFG
ncbi:Hint domain-containing protein [Pseudoruegeria sp. HB172150]|uniref:Hint domain-containing protein n=1 Tax=Pseudoruegeria sp. HB172150 TaxID=2721164 RepID=UPI001552CF92|nr:Hint domain-containing protein [Pseudoruegeria sp. HB172150]